MAVAEEAAAGTVVQEGEATNRTTEAVEAAVDITPVGEDTSSSRARRRGSRLNRLSSYRRPRRGRPSQLNLR